MEMETTSTSANTLETPTAIPLPPRNKGGRPSKAKIAEREGGTKWAKEMISLYEAGASDVEVCAHLRLTEKEFEKRYKEDSLFQRLTQIGRLHAKSFWYKQSRLNLNNRSFNTLLFIKTMQNRYGWADKTENTESKPENQMSEDELKEEIASLTKRFTKKYQDDVLTSTQLNERSN